MFHLSCRQIFFVKINNLEALLKSYTRIGGKKKYSSGEDAEGKSLSFKIRYMFMMAY